MLKFFKLSGHFEGKYHLWLKPGSEASISNSRMTISSVLNNTFLQLDYSWVEETEQKGSLLVTFDTHKKKVNASWVDTWHMGSEILQCEGYMDNEDKIVIQGYYPVGEGPSWGWRTELIKEEDVLELLMYNETPQGQEMLAVKCRYLPI